MNGTKKAEISTKNLARRHVAEQAEGEADQPHEFAEGFQWPDEEEVQQPLEGIQ